MQDSSVSWLTRIVGLLFLSAALAVILMYGQKYSTLEFGGPAERLQLLWEQDLERLKASSRLPPGWSRIKEIQLIPATESAKQWVKNIQVPIQLKSDGVYKLEILIVSWEEGAQAGAIVQYNLVDIKTNNMVWELGRTFVLKDNDKEASEVVPAAVPVPKNPPPEKVK